jgi:hypothetical protein
MTPWMFDVKFSRGTQLTFGSLTSTTGEDKNLSMLPVGRALECLTPEHGKDSCHPPTSSTSGGAYKGLDSCPATSSILWPWAGASDPSSSTASPDQDSSDDYPKIRISTCVDSTGEGRLIFMVAPIRDPSHNSSSRYPTIRRSEVSNARTPSHGMIQNLNLYFNVM